ncbi:hypothetical protein NLJ89_g11142 [Agrocybe chaxingu]|uniref:Uncharacterized protein n=1 Tax=Agrocybe chaxingu TaxID=84603 RepID=A0A9W8MPM3_9AGAR|nr:hypothetical protein NLJ89_g11142 [Agrocybe chaxingu]
MAAYVNTDLDPVTGVGLVKFERNDLQPQLYDRLKEAFCQKEAWKCATLPHKPVCTKIHSLKESLSTDNWELPWVPDRNYRHFQSMCQGKGIATEDVEAIARTISSLRIRKAAFRDDEQRAGESQVERLMRTEQRKVADRIQEDVVASVGEESITVFSREEALARHSYGAIL